MRVGRLLRGCGTGAIMAWTAAVILSSCSGGKTDAPAKPPVMEAPVSVAPVEQRQTTTQIKALGSVEAFATVSVRSQIGGTLATVHFTEGQEVKKGDLLFTIDPRPLEAAVKLAEATLAKDTAQLENAKRDLARSGELSKSGFVTKEKYDQQHTTVTSLEAVIKSDMTAVENAKLQLSYCYIRANVPGVTGSLLFNQGNLIKANDDKSMVVIRQIQPVYVTFTAPEKYLGVIRRHMAAGDLPALAAPPGEEDAPETGRLAFIENSVDAATGTIKMKAVYDNASKRLWPGQFVNVALKLAMRMNSIVVPSQAVQTGQQGQYVFVVKPDMTAEIRQVETGEAMEGYTLIEKGLEVEEKVVTDGQLRLAPGVKVKIRGEQVDQKETGK